MKTHKTTKTIIAIKLKKKNSPPQKLLPYYSPFLTKMAKGLQLVREAIKPSCEQVDLVLDSSNPVINLICNKLVQKHKF